jgi:hypothetical protein
MKKEADVFEKALEIAGRISGRNPVPPPPPGFRPADPDEWEPGIFGPYGRRRINSWEHRREIPEEPGMNYRNGRRTM